MRKVREEVMRRRVIGKEERGGAEEEREGRSKGVKEEGEVSG